MSDVIGILLTVLCFSFLSVCLLGFADVCLFDGELSDYLKDKIRSWR